MIGHLVSRRVDHVRGPERVRLLGEGQVGRVHRARVEERAGERCAGVGGRGLLGVRAVPPQTAGRRPAAGRVPRGHDVGVERLGLGEIRRVAREIVGAEERERGPVLVVVVVARPADGALDLVEGAERTGEARALVPGDGVEHAVPRLLVGPVAGERGGAHRLVEVLLARVPEREHHRLHGVVGFGVRLRRRGGVCVDRGLGFTRRVRGSAGFGVRGARISSVARRGRVALRRRAVVGGRGSVAAAGRAGPAARDREREGPAGERATHAEG